MFKLINFSLKAVIIILISSLVLLFSAFFYFSSGLPDYKKLSNYQPPISSRVYSKEGSLIAEYALEKRLFVPYDSIPNKVINSFLSAEDKNFFNHPGVDAKGILRATINNIKNILGDKRLEGASTITQQVAKNFLLTNEVSLKRKIKEAILAFRIEKALSYDEAALLAALPKAPSRYNPVKDPVEAKFRRDLVLKNLNQNGYINDKEFSNLK